MSRWIMWLFLLPVFGYPEPRAGGIVPRPVRGGIMTLSERRGLWDFLDFSTGERIGFRLGILFMFFL